MNFDQLDGWFYLFSLFELQAVRKGFMLKAEHQILVSSLNHDMKYLEAVHCNDRGSNDPS
jgi:hypothetical protein